MNDEDYKRWDTVLKLAGALVLVVGVVGGGWQYRTTTEKEFKQKYWEQQLALYIEATNTASTLATIPKIEDETESKGMRDKAKVRFWQLYYGPLALVTDKDVDAAVVEFGNCLRQY